MTLITEVSEQEGKIACSNTYSQMELCRKSINVTLNELFLYDPNSLQNHEEEGIEQFALVTEVRVDDRTNNKTLFKFALVKGEDGRGILTVFDSASTTTLILRDLVERGPLSVRLTGNKQVINGVGGNKMLTCNDVMVQ